MRVAMYLEGLDCGGIETFCVNLIQPLQGLGHTVDFLILKEKDYVYLSKVRSLMCSVDYLIKADEVADASGFAQCRNMYNWARCHCGEIDVLHMHISHLANAFPLYLAARFGGISRIVLHAHSSQAPTSKATMLHNLFRGLLVPSRRVKLLACSDAAGLWMYGKRKYAKINNGIDLQAFEFDKSGRERIRQEFKIGESQRVICNVARLSPVKNQTFLLKVFERFQRMDSDSVLLFVGVGELEDDLKCEAEELGVSNKVIFAGLRRDIPAILSASDCLVFPSLYEGLSVACVEAQANGIPLILSDGVSSETVMSSKTTIVPLSETTEQWCRQIHAFMKRRFEPACYSDIFQSYDIRETARKLDETYQALLKG